VLEVLYHHVTFDGARISLATGTVKNVEFFVCLSVCLSVMLLNVRVCAPDFVIKSLEHRNNFMYVCMYVSFGQGSSLLWTHTLRPFYSRPIALTQEGGVWLMMCANVCVTEE